MNEEYLMQLEEENDRLRKENADIIAQSPPSDNPLVSEKNFRLLTGADEIPEKYKRVFEDLLAASTQWMYVKSAEEEDDWVDRAAHHIKTWKMTYPFSGLTLADEQSILIYFRRYLNRGFCGFERNGINTAIQTVNYQSQPIAPQATGKKMGFFDRINPFRR